jgi:aspartyl-tRNA synthetase
MTWNTSHKLNKKHEYIKSIQWSFLWVASFFVCQMETKRNKKGEKHNPEF